MDDQKVKDAGVGSSRLTTDAASPKQDLSSTEECLGDQQRQSSQSLPSRGSMSSSNRNVVEDLELVPIQHTDIPPVTPSQITNLPVLVESEEQGRLHRENEDWRKNALLNLPPPLPFDLALEMLTIGVPDRKALRYVG